MTITIMTSKQLWKSDLELLPKRIIEKLIRNQVRFYSRGLPTHTSQAMVSWCNKNCNGLFRYTDDLFYFEEESDMVAFKIAWDGKDEDDE